MKRFIRYLYEYQNGKRTRNTGFVKVLEQTDTAEIQIYGRGFPVAGGRTLEIYLFYEEDGKCIGIRMGEIRGAQAAFGYKLIYTTDDVGGDGQFGKIGGMILRTGNGADAGYYGAVWDEARPVDVSRMITEDKTQMQLGNRKAIQMCRKKETLRTQIQIYHQKPQRISSIRSPDRRLPDFRERNGSLRIIIFFSMDIIITIIWYHLKKKGNAGLGFRDFIFRVSSGRQEHSDSISS